MKVKRIITKKEKMIKYYDLIAFIVCFIITCIRFRNHGGFLLNISVNYKVTSLFNPLLGIIVTLLYILLTVARKSLIVLVIYLVWRNSILNKIKQDTKYTVIDNIEYYRETFKDLTPGEISLITDLGIEVKKDITATLLKLQLDKYIEINDNYITILNTDTSKLKRSELILFESIKDGNLNFKDKMLFEQTCIDETISDGYITRNENDKKVFKNVISTILLIFAIFTFITGCTSVKQLSNSNYSEKLDEYVKYEEQRNKDLFGEDFYELSEKEQLQLVNEKPELLYGVIKETFKLAKDIKPLLIILLKIIGGFILIILLIVYKAAKKSADKYIEFKNKYKRTKDGNILVEQIAATKRLIHDFSNLSESSKQEVILWKEFLIYAILLEENESIIDKIYSMNNLKKININIEEETM